MTMTLYEVVCDIAVEDPLCWQVNDSNVVTFWLFFNDWRATTKFLNDEWEFDEVRILSMAHVKLLAVEGCAISLLFEA